MLATFSTHLSRAKRKRQAFPMIEVQQFATADAVIEVAEAEKASIALICSGSLHLTHAILSRARDCKQPVVVMARCRTVEEIADALFTGCMGVLVEVYSFSPKNRLKDIEELSTLCFSRGAASVVEWPVTEKIPTELLESTIDALVLTKPETVNSTFLTELSSYLIRKSRVPVFLEADSLPPPTLEKILKAGVEGFYSRSSTEEAFLAGLRTGLRNRSISQVDQYEKYARKAAREAVKNILNRHC